MSCVEVLEGRGHLFAGESTDFVQSHVDSFFPPTEEEGIDEDYLLMNSTGDRPYKAVDVTEDIYTLGLPEGVLELIPIVPPKMSELGEINEGLVASVSAAISDYAGFVWNGICAIGEFLESVGSYVAEIGLAVLGTIWDALSAIGDAVVSALNVLVDWVVGKIKQAVNSLLSPITSTINKWVSGVQEGINQLSGNPSDAIHMSALLSAIFDLTFWIFMLKLFLGLLGTIGTIAIIATVVTGGVGATITTLIVRSIIKEGTDLGEIASGLTSSIYATWVVERIYELIVPEDSSYWKNSIGASLTAIGVGVSILSALLYFKTHKEISFTAKLDLLGLVVSIGGFFLSTLVGGTIGSIIGVIFCIYGVVWTVFNHDPLDNLPGGVGYLEEVIAGISLGWSVGVLLDDING